MKNKGISNLGNLPTFSSFPQDKKDTPEVADKCYVPDCVLLKSKLGQNNGRT